MSCKWLCEKLIIRSIGEMGKLTNLKLMRIMKCQLFTQRENLIEAIELLLSQGLISKKSFKGKRSVYRLTAKGNRLYRVIEDYPGLHPFYEEIYARTLTDESLGNQVEFVECFFEEWVGNFLHPFGNDLLHGNKLSNSVFYCYLASQSMVLDWLAHSLLFGAYEVVLRELRSILEGLFTAYYLDINYPHRSLEEKLDALSDLEKKGLSHGKKAFKMSGISRWEDYYSLFSELCSYVHSSREVMGRKMRQIAQKGYAEAPDVHFDPVTFIKCVEVWKKVAMLAANLAGSLLVSLNIEIRRTNPQIFNPST
jgi:predicted transcriptional regulator